MCRAGQLCAPPVQPGWLQQGSTTYSNTHFPQLRAALLTEGYWKMHGKTNSSASCFARCQHPQGCCTVWPAQPVVGSAPSPACFPAINRRWPRAAEFPAEGMATMRGRARHLPSMLTAGPICVSHPLCSPFHQAKYAGRAAFPPPACRQQVRNDLGSLPPNPRLPHSCGQAGAKFIPDTSPPALLDLDPR